ncbi:MAG: hypothetical protein SV910_08630 [Chloroflexota bacterium]|nr:hypothetical protein [Chloroflexota bacterium]
MESVLQRKGLTFSVEIARQGGKNELSAQLEVLLLSLFMGRGGNLVKCAPTYRPQTVVSMTRLKERLNDAGLGPFWVPEHGYMVRLGAARQLFFSADRSSHVVGATAHILLEIDESQDVAREKYSKEFRPMGATTNVTSVLYGTTWDDSTLLEEVKRENLERERSDGIRRHFRFDWEEVARHCPDYRRYVEGERARLGEGHPLFQTQYCLKPIHGGGNFLSSGQRGQLQGGHPRHHHPQAGRLYIAGVDLAGECEDAQDALLRASKPRQDSTVVTIAELDLSATSDIDGEPRVSIVEHRWWTGTPHPDLYRELVQLLGDTWGCRRVVVDATGVGAGVASFLGRSLGRGVVEPFIFTQQSKSRLGFQLIAAINSGRVKMYAADGSEECRQFWHQAERARSVYRPSQTLSFFVDPQEGHDDFLMSLALLVEAASYRPRSARSRAAGR